MRVFVTGGSGFIGGHVIERLSREHEVRAMARSSRSERAVAALGATPVSCDLETLDASHLEGCDAVVHCAARVEEWGTRAQFFAANVDGTVRALSAARQAGARRFVHIGTEAALFDGHDLVDIDESAPYPSRHRFLYSESKAEAERRVLSANDDRMTTLSLRPRLVWGPRDTSVLPAIVRMAREGAFAWIDGGRHRTSTVHVENVAHAVSLALGAGRPGSAYFIVDAGTRTLRDFLTRLAATQGVALPSRSIPGFVARPLAALVEGAHGLLGREGPAPMSRFAVTMMSRTVTIKSVRAEADLGYRPVIDVDAGLARLAVEAPSSAGALQVA